MRNLFLLALWSASTSSMTIYWLGWCEMSANFTFNQPTGLSWAEIIASRVAAHTNTRLLFAESESPPLRVDLTNFCSVDARSAGNGLVAKRY